MRQGLALGSKYPTRSKPKSGRLESWSCTHTTQPVRSLPYSLPCVVPRVDLWIYFEASLAATDTG